jgi:hypothetical protein
MQRADFPIPPFVPGSAATASDVDPTGPNIAAALADKSNTDHTHTGADLVTQIGTLSSAQTTLALAGLGVSTEGAYPLKTLREVIASVTQDGIVPQSYDVSTLADSTFAGDGMPIRILAGLVAAARPELTVEYALWTAGSQAFPEFTRIQTGADGERRLILDVAQGVNAFTASVATAMPADIWAKAHFKLPAFPPASKVNLCSAGRTGQ